MKYLIFFILIFPWNQAMTQDKPDISVGEPAPGFVLKNNKNENVSLNDFKRKVLLLDFWASYCGPCRQQYQTLLIPLYKMLKTKNFEILGVSKDTDEEKWTNAIIKDDLPWPQVIVSGNEDVLTNYKIEYIPTSVLIDKNGILLGKNLTKTNLVETIYNSLDNKEDISFTDLMEISQKYISWEEFWIDWFYEVDKYIYDHSKYPKEAAVNNISGCIPVIIVIGEDFKIKFSLFMETVPGTNGKEKVKKLGYGCEEEALRVIETMKKWKSWPYVQKENTYSGSVDVCFPPKKPVKRENLFSK